MNSFQLDSFADNPESLSELIAALGSLEPCPVKNILQADLHSLIRQEALGIADPTIMDAVRQQALATMSFYEDYERLNGQIPNTEAWVQFVKLQVELEDGQLTEQPSSDSDDAWRMAVHRFCELFPLDTRDILSTRLSELHLFRCNPIGVSRPIEGPIAPVASNVAEFDDEDAFVVDDSEPSSVEDSGKEAMITSAPQTVLSHVSSVTLIRSPSPSLSPSEPPPNTSIGPLIPITSRNVSFHSDPQVFLYTPEGSWPSISQESVPSPPSPPASAEIIVSPPQLTQIPNDVTLGLQVEATPEEVIDTSSPAELFPPTPTPPSPTSAPSPPAPTLPSPRRSSRLHGRRYGMWDANGDRQPDEETPEPSPVPASTVGRRRWSEREDAELEAGVKLYGEGRWRQILTGNQWLASRGAVGLKDRWRQLKRTRR